jgi:putative lipoprotein
VRGIVLSGVLLALSAGCAVSSGGTPTPTTAAPETSAAARPAVTPAAAGSGLSGTTWRASAPSAGSEAAASVPAITFDSLEHVSGTTGCNRFSGRVLFDGDRVRIGPLATTRRGCAAPLMEQEKAFLGAIEAARSWRRAGGGGGGGEGGGDVLELRDESGAVVLRLVPASGDAQQH